MTEVPRYFEVSWESTGDGNRVAQPLTHTFDVYRQLRKPGRLTDPPNLHWSWASRSHPPGDQVVVADGLRVVSPKLRDILEAHRTADDEIQWLPATVFDPDRVAHQYWVAHFPQQLDLLNHEHSTFGPSGLPIRYVLSAAKLVPHSVTVMGNAALTFILARHVVDDIRQAACVGLRWAKVAVGP